MADNKKLKFSKLLNAHERHTLIGFLFSWMPMLLNAKQPTYLIFGEIVRNTVSSDRLEWVIDLPKYFLSPENGFSKIIKRRQFYYSLRTLEDSGLIQIESRKDKKAFRLNMPGILYAIQYLWGDVSLNFAWKGEAEEWYRKFSELWSDNGWKTDLGLMEKQEHLMKLKDSVDKAKQQSKEAQKRNREKKAAKADKKAGFIKDAMRAAYEEHFPGITYTETWTGKVAGMAANWLKELNTTDPPLDPAEEIDKVVRNWRWLSGHTKDDRGNNILLGRLPTFEKYYKFRSYINDALVTINEKTGKDWVSRIKFKKGE